MVLKRKRSIVFIGGKQIGADCLRILLSKGVRPDLVISNLEDKGKDIWHESLIRIAKKEKLPLITGLKVRDKEVTSKIVNLNPEIIFSIGGTHLIPKEVIDASSLGCFNIHPALLPKYRGRYSTVHALFNGEKEIGVTAHWMDMGIDSGPVIIQKKFKVSNSDTAKTVYDNFTKLGDQIFSDFLKFWLKGEIPKAKKQDESKATYYPMGLPNNGEINWDWDGKKIYNFVRSMTFEPFPPASFYIGNKKMVIVDEKYFKGFK